VKIPIPFSNGKSLDIRLKSQDTFFNLTDHNVREFIGFDSFKKQSQNEQELINNGYGSNVTAFAIIKRIADAGANLPKQLINADKPDEEPITKGEVYDILQRPGVLQGEILTQFDFFEAVITYLLATGNTYLHGQTPIGFGKEWRRLEILPSGLTMPIVDPKTYRAPIKGYQFQDKSNASLAFESQEIIHTKYVNPTQHGLNTLEGLSPLQASIFSLTGSNDIQKAISIMVKNQGARGILTNDSERIMDPDELGTLTEKLNQDTSGVKNFNRIHATTNTLSYQQIGLNANDLKIIESGVLTDRQLCNAYGVSSRLFNDPANSTFNNVKEANKAMYQNAVLPTLNKIIEDLNRFWLAQYSMRDGVNYQLQVDTSSVEALQADQKTEAEKDKIRMEGVDKVFNMPISSQAKTKLLVDEYGYTEETAALLVAPEGGANATLEKLKSMSPLLANKLLESLTPEEVAQLLR
jgi:HK97 family phage portal protein